MTRPPGVLLVRAGKRRVGLELSRVLEVTEIGQVHPVPSVDPAVAGVTAVQGRLVPVVHLGSLLEGGAIPPHPGDLAVLVLVEGSRMCLVIDDAEVVVHEPTFPVPPGSTLPWASGVARHPSGLVPLLDLTALSSRFTEAA